jgi:hypothetical protein
MRKVLEEYTPIEGTGTATPAAAAGPTTAAPVNPRDSRVSRASMSSNGPSHATPVTAAPSAKTLAAGETLDDAREYVRRVLGHHYMQMHGVDSKDGFTVHIEDARMVLKAFWYMSENRLHTDVESTVDQMILQKVSVQIEQELLSQFQVWCANGGPGDKGGKGSSNLPKDLLPPVPPSTDGTSFYSAVSSGYSLADILAEDPTAVKKRSELVQQRVQYNDALKKVYEISPHSAALTEKNSPFK